MNKQLYIGILDVPNSKNFGHKAITLFQNSPMVHAFTAIGVPGKISVYETSSTTFREVSLESRLAGTPAHLFRVKADVDQVAKVEAYMQTLLGQPYDYPSIIGLGIFLLAERLANLIAYPIKKLFKLPEIRLEFLNPYNLDNPALVYCVEAVLNGLDAGAIPHDFPDNASVIAPVLFNYLASRPEAFELVDSKGLL